MAATPPLADWQLRGSPALLRRAAAASSGVSKSRGQQSGSYIAANHGTQLYYKDWSTGRPVVFCHGWPLSSDGRESQMMPVTSNGFRAIAHGHRGYGRSSQPWSDNEMDTYADDLATMFDTLGRRDAILCVESHLRDLRGQGCKVEVVREPVAVPKSPEGDG
ncbi:hypothetical protein PPGU19_061720 (plasmid) [Paraburkholderia sp. PGU19]|nr:hypothetical protein PPGU19_061720 [Paraburkholderia sp. PGU19]